jgi:cytochrome b involved in lipid metabolism
VWGFLRSTRREHKNDTAMGPVKGTIRRYYTPYEVAQHNTPDDCWVSFLGSVYDITRLIKVRLLPTRSLAAP